MVVVAIVIHIILSGQVVLFGSLYRFQDRSVITNPDDLVYFQDKKLVTQNITEYTKITNLQNDIWTTLEEIEPAMVHIISGTITTGTDLYNRLKDSKNHGRVLTNDGLILVDRSDQYATWNRSIVTREGEIYGVNDFFALPQKNIGILRIVIPAKKQLLSKTIAISSYQSPFHLGQMLLQVSLLWLYPQINICMITQIQEHNIVCEDVVGKIQPGFLLSMYWEIVWIYHSNQIKLLSKEQTQQRISFIATSATGSYQLPRRNYEDDFQTITPLVRGLTSLTKEIGRLVSKNPASSLFTWVKAGEIIKSINDVSAVWWRSIEDLLNGFWSGEKIIYKK